MSSRTKDGLNIAITGAAGAVGHYLVAQAVAAGHSVIAIDLPGRDFPEVEGQVEFRLGDLTRRRFCKKAVVGADVVIHAAASTDPALDYNAQSAINVDAVRWLYEAAEDEGAGRFVHLSTASLYRPRRGVLNEEGDTEATSPHTETKADAERYLRSRPKGAMPWAILRPSLAYGPRCVSVGAALLTVPPLLRMFFRYVPGLTGGARNNWVHVEDIASAALLVATHPGAGDQIFNVADETPLAYGEILSAVIQSYGLHIGPTFPFPLALLGAFGPFVDSDMAFRFVSGIVGPLWKRTVQRHKLTGPLKPGVYRAGLAYLQGDRVIVTDKLAKLGWTPRWPDLREGMGPTVQWYQQKGWVPDYHALPDDEILEEAAGLRYSEHLLCEDPEGHLSLDVTFPSLRRLALDQDAVLAGTVTLAGLATESPIVGTLKVHKARRDMVYEFAFDGDDGASYRFQGRKHLTLLGVVGDFSRIDGALVSTRGEHVGDLHWRMNLKEDFGALLRSFQIV